VEKKESRKKNVMFFTSTFEWNHFNYYVFSRIISCHALGVCQLMPKTVVQFQKSNTTSSLFNSSTSSLFVEDQQSSFKNYTYIVALLHNSKGI